MIWLGWMQRNLKAAMLTKPNPSPEAECHSNSPEKPTRYSDAILHSTSQYTLSHCAPIIMSAAVLEPINPQYTSPLFNRIPAEIRNYIFKLALTAYDDHTKPYKNGEYYYRPGHRYAHKVDTNLLLTCRRVLAETKEIPASINEYTCWFERGPPWASTNGLTRLASEDAVGAPVRRRVRLRTLKCVHLFTQQTWLEGSFTHFADLWKSATPTHLTITLRHSDWWWWEHEAPLALEPKHSTQDPGFSSTNE